MIIDTGVSAHTNRFHLIATLCALLALGASKPAKSGSNTLPVLSLQAAKWTTIAVLNGQSTDLPKTNDATGALVLTIPQGVDGPAQYGTLSSLNYLSTALSRASIAGYATLAVTFKIATTGSPVFNSFFEPDNICPSPSRVNAFFWSHRNGSGEFDRWFAHTEFAYVLVAGNAQIVVPLQPSAWGSVYGKSGDQDSTTLQAFASALADVSQLGVTFGGHCYAGHGVNVQQGSGTAQVVLTDYRVQ